MSKGKNFDAAEKHFEKKRIDYERRIKSLSIALSESRQQTSQYKELYEGLINENEQLKAWVERLLEYTELSMEDIKQACEKDKKVGEAMSMMSALFKMSGGYF
jgi:bisphosphoglycerate-dependent phosphoglycerate mutase